MRAAPASLTNLLWGLHAGRVRPPPAVLAAALPVVGAALPRMRGDQLSAMLAALAGLDAYDADVFDRAAATLLTPPLLTATSARGA
eukprot:312161-Chlamydomonas_euryale.AAC.1